MDDVQVSTILGSCLSHVSCPPMPPAYQFVHFNSDKTGEKTQQNYRPSIAGKGRGAKQCRGPWHQGRNETDRQAEGDPK